MIALGLSDAIIKSGDQGTARLTAGGPTAETFGR
jgi:hypothetical protein